MKKIFLALCGFMISTQAIAESIFYQSSGTFLVPESVYRLHVRVVGGTGGHGASCYARKYGYPGGAGGYRQSTVGVYPGQIINVYVGAGGEGACGGGGGGGGGGVEVVGANFSLWAGGGGGGRGTGGGCAFCGDYGGNGFAILTW